MTSCRSVIEKWNVVFEQGKTRVTRSITLRTSVALERVASVEESSKRRRARLSALPHG